MMTTADLKSVHSLETMRKFHVSLFYRCTMLFPNLASYFPTSVGLFSFYLILEDVRHTFSINFLCCEISWEV